MSFTREVLTQAVTFCHCADYNPKTSIGNPFAQHPRHFIRVGLLVGQDQA
jgi:hypothetical protein